MSLKTHKCDRTPVKLDAKLIQKGINMGYLGNELSGDNVGLSPGPVCTPRTATLAREAGRVSRVLSVKVFHANLNCSK